MTTVIEGTCSGEGQGHTHGSATSLLAHYSAAQAQSDSGYTKTDILAGIKDSHV